VREADAVLATRALAGNILSNNSVNYRMKVRHNVVNNVVTDNGARSAQR
jgi:hypothetical protein